MKVNQEKLEAISKRDLFGEMPLPDCPKELKSACHNVLAICQALDGYLDYRRVSSWDKKLCLEYWNRFDCLQQCLGGAFPFQIWWMSATSPDMIARASRWLRENDYIKLRPEVEREAGEAQEHWRRDLKSPDNSL